MGKVPKFATPTRMPLHHVPNVLPTSHKREDYDFDYADGVWGPIRVAAVNVPAAFVDLPPMVWCRRHGWENEIIPDGDLFTVPGLDGSPVWGWRCPTCGRTRHESRFSKERAGRSLGQHKADKHAGVVPFRLHGKTAPGAVHPAAQS